MSVKLRRARLGDLPYIVELEREPHAERFITPSPICDHQAAFARDDVEYLMILDAAESPAGFFILNVESGGASVEFRRIVVDVAKQGIGQGAITAMERFCAEELGTRRIWLDVYDDNARGIHVYEKLGYRRFNSEPRGERVLHFYEKAVVSSP